jgi:hypothetical protein
MKIARMFDAKCSTEDLASAKYPLARLGIPSSSKGLTLPELLIASLLGVLMITIGLGVSQNALQTNYRLLTAQELRDNWNKIALLINSDIAESCSAIGSNSSLVLRVLPSAESSVNPCATSPDGKTVTYSLSGTTLSRTGPRVRSDGSLSSNSQNGQFLASNTQVIADNVSMFQVLSDGSSSFYPQYTLTLSQNGVSYSGSSSGYQASRSRIRSFD